MLVLDIWIGLGKMLTAVRHTSFLSCIHSSIGRALGPNLFSFREWKSSGNGLCWFNVIGIFRAEYIVRPATPICVQSTSYTLT